MANFVGPALDAGLREYLKLQLLHEQHRREHVYVFSQSIFVIRYTLILHTGRRGELCGAGIRRPAAGAPEAALQPAQ